MTSLTWDRHRGHARSYDVLANGYNYRLDELRAALGSAQLLKLDRNNAVRRQLTSAYRANLAGQSGWTIPFQHYRGDTSAHLMVAVAPDPETREEGIAALRNARIQTSMHYPLIPSFTVFKSRDLKTRNGSTDLDMSVVFSSRAVTLPLFPSLKEREIAEISSILCREREPEPKGDAPTNARFDAGSR
jgi:dTDP-4-amino-4,6-dideoxygalactose transaminase